MGHHEELTATYHTSTKHIGQKYISMLGQSSHKKKIRFFSWWHGSIVQM